ncbi:MAG: RecX family transcriptional regulator [Hymenobacteraceae bacterium]|nr:RecX family transcriptional regulator [Hymenobacteraceae bacterium]
MTYKQALVKAAAYCAYQERTQQQVRTKAAEWELEPNEVEELVAEMVTQKFVNEERYARSYVRGKYAARRWGRRLLVQGLREQKLSDYCIRAGMSEIDPDVYWENLLGLAAKKARSVAGESHPMKRKAKVLAYLASKGYESDLARDAAEQALAYLGKAGDTDEEADGGDDF